MKSNDVQYMLNSNIKPSSLRLGRCFLILSFMGCWMLLPFCLRSQSEEKADAVKGWNAPFIKVKKNAPNILWICTDQQKWNTIGALGNPYVKTPHIDRLVKEGVSFTKAFCQAPFCTPSRASFLTGMYPSTLHTTKNGVATWAEAAPLITKTLKDAGYECGLAGKLHLSSAMVNRPELRAKDDGYQVFNYSHSPYQGGAANQYIKYWRDKGVDILKLKTELGYVPAQYHQTTWCVDRAIDFISDRREWPWMFSLNIYDPHGPLDPPKEYLDRYDLSRLPDPLFKESDLKEKSVFNNVKFQSQPKKYTAKQNRERLARYWAQIDLIDENIGRLLNVLKETGQLDNTLIIFTSDHGDMTGDHGLINKGCRFYESLVRVPLIFWYPSLFERNIQSDALVELTDIVPSILELVGLPRDKKMQGQSLLPILTGKKTPGYHRDFVRSEYYDDDDRTDASLGYGTMFRTQEYKLVVYHGHSMGELFDLKKDPDEYRNLWDDPSYTSIKMDLLRQSFDATVHAIDTGPERSGRY
ncbi:sulfatase family protein [Niabella insulamsoli]|uniref:sulfatase family protein n=1 Tax=Niabella insulamsoli TaxID=3144874 RepID=UPI0031FC068F